MFRAVLLSKEADLQPKKKIILPRFLQSCSISQVYGIISVQTIVDCKFRSLVVVAMVYMAIVVVTIHRVSITSFKFCSAEFRLLYRGHF